MGPNGHRVERRIVNGHFIDAAGEEVAPAHAGCADGPFRSIDRQRALRVEHGGDLNPVAVEVPMSSVIRANQMNPSIGAAEITRGYRSGSTVEGDTIRGANHVIRRYAAIEFDAEEDLVAAELPAGEDVRVCGSVRA